MPWSTTVFRYVSRPRTAAGCGSSSNIMYRKLAARPKSRRGETGVCPCRSRHIAATIVGAWATNEIARRRLAGREASDGSRSTRLRVSSPSRRPSIGGKPLPAAAASTSRVAPGSFALGCHIRRSGPGVPWRPEGDRATASRPLPRSWRSGPAPAPDIRRWSVCPPGRRPG